VKTGGLPLASPGIWGSACGRRLLERTADERLGSGTLCDLFPWAQRALMRKDGAWVCSGAWAVVSVSARAKFQPLTPEPFWATQAPGQTWRREDYGLDCYAISGCGIPDRQSWTWPFQSQRGVRWMNGIQELLMDALRPARLYGHRPWLQSWPGCGKAVLSPAQGLGRSRASARSEARPPTP
jgi:hypothetical protein